MKAVRRGGRAAGAASVLVLVTTLAVPGAAGATPSPVPEVQLVVKLAGHAAMHPSDVLSSLPGSVPQSAPAARWTLRVPAGEVAATEAQLRAHQGVQYVSRVQHVHAFDVPADACYQVSCGPTVPPVYKVLDYGNGYVAYNPTSASQPDLPQVKAPQAWSITHGSPNVTVAILDTGVDANQEDLTGKVTVGPVLCAMDDPACQGVQGPNTDDSAVGHGTHVTGTVAAHTNNGVGVASLGWDTHAETYKVLDSSGGGTTYDVATGIYDAVADGAKVINMSLGNDACSVNPSNCGPDPDTQAAVEYAESHGVVVVAAAGNDASSDPTYPAGYPGVLSVASVGANGATSYFSEYGSAANIAAPGENILSTWNDAKDGGKYTNTYAVLSGTSMAAPHVAAAAALLFAADPSLDAAQVTSYLESTAAPASGTSFDGGILDVNAALQAAAAHQAYAGYRLAGTDGSVYPFGASPFFGDLAGQPLNQPVVGVASRPDETGYWMVARDGGIFTFGSAGFYGSEGGVKLNQPIVGMAATPSGRGYWLVASDGGIFTFGDAGFYGSTGSYRLNKPVVGMAATPSGRGYWLVASDGGIFTFGDAGFYGSTGSYRLNKPVVGMAATPSGRGYWLVASDGGIFTFGDAGFHGSTGSYPLNKPIVAMQSSSDGAGYWLVASDGGIFTFGDAHFEGSAGGQQIPAPVVGMSS